MEFHLSSIESRVQKIKKNIFSSDFNLYSFVCPSAYDTAWLAMIPDLQHPSKPMFKNYLDWLLNNQKPEGFWGETDTFGKSTVESLPATFVSMVALKKWNTGASMVDKGRSFIHANADELLNEVKDGCPRWLAIVFPAMIELADTMGLDVVFSESSKKTMSYILRCQKCFLNGEELVGDLHCYPPLLSYLEALPPSLYVSEKDICSNLDEDGSLFQSPSATAKAFMNFGKQECLTYLKSLAQRCPYGVPQAYPMDEDFIKLCVVNQLQKLGLSEYFVREIEVLLAQIYRNYNMKQNLRAETSLNPLQLQKDSLAFELLRIHGFKVSPSSFCWFLKHDEIRAQVEMNHEHFSSAMLQIFRASNLMFCGESELEEARTFSRKLLEKIVSTVLNGGRLRQMEHELNLPWFARLDHLEHRMWLEEREANALWKGKASYNRVSNLYIDELLQLATLNFETKQLLYKTELKELKSWVENYGISEMGFGREKSTYCYFAVVASCTLIPHDSYIRMLLAKSASIITVADDFFDMKGSLNELEILTDAIQRWDSSGLSSHSKVIFDALDNLVSEATSKYLQQEGTTIDDISASLKDLWYEAFLSWLVEAKWGRNGHKPSIDNYLKIGMISIATHIMVLPASCFLKPSLPIKKLRPISYEPITTLLMVISRLLNDIESHQKEKEEGKLNSVVVNMIENPELDIEDSVAHVREMVESKKKEFLEVALIDGICDLPKPSKQLHLSCLKVFQMFFNSTNKFDSKTELVVDINKAIYLPLRNNTTKCFSPQTSSKKKYTTTKLNINFSFKHNSRRNFNIGHQVSSLTLRKGYQMAFMAPKMGIGFI